MSAVLFQNMPPLSGEEYSALEQSIRDHGVQVPIIVDEYGVVVDGHHRQKITQELGIECPSTTVSGKSDAEKRTLALSLNLDRRHLNREQRRALIAESIKADPQLSDREHGRRTGASKNTAASVRGELEESGQIDHFSERIDPRTGNATHVASRPNSGTALAEQNLRDAAEIMGGVNPVTGEVLGTCEIADRPQATTPEPVRRTEPSKPRRRPITDAFFEATYDLGKLVERIERLTEDDRFPRNKNEIAQSRKSDLVRAADTLASILRQFD